MIDMAEIIDLKKYPDLQESEISYQMAKSAFIEDNRFIFNSSIGGELEIFPRKKLQDFLYEQ
jgi:hypothetical protein